MSTSVPDSGDVKTANRDSRLSYLRKNNEEVLRKQMQAEAREICSGVTEAFVNCSKASGLLVVLRCREQSKAMSECLDLHYNENKFREYARDRGYNLRPKET